MRLSVKLPTLADVARDRRAPAKPSGLERRLAKHTATVKRRKLKAALDREDAKEQTARRRAVFDRDQSRSRASGKLVKWQSDNPAEIGHRHHIRFRSLGGDDSLSNLVLLTEAEHEMAHARGSKFVLDIFGDANKTLRFVKRHLETGQVIKAWESPCP